MAVQIQFRRGSEIEWISANPVLAAGELGLALDVTKFKIGDGIKFWNELSYVEGVGGGGGGNWSVATTDGSAITISTGAATNTLYYGNFITVESTHDHPYLGSGESTYYQTSNLSSVFLTTAALSNHTHSDLYQSTGDYLTTAMVSNAGSNFIGLNSGLTNLTGTIDSSGVYLSALDAGTLSFQNSNGVSFGSSSDGHTTSVTASVQTAYIPLSNSTSYMPVASSTRFMQIGNLFFVDSGGASWSSSVNGVSSSYWIVTA